jgi:hypothetical protein|nr:MAG TPA: hypothetical protein [Caudoviricetes sp.]
MKFNEKIISNLSVIWQGFIRLAQEHQRKIDNREHAPVDGNVILGYHLYKLAEQVHS